MSNNNQFLCKDLSYTSNRSSIQTSEGKTKVIKFISEEEHIQNDYVRNRNPLNVTVKKQQTVSFDSENNTNKFESTNPKDAYFENQNFIDIQKPKQQVVSFTPENVDIKNKIQKNNINNSDLIGFTDINFIIASTGHLYVDSTEGILELCNFYISPIKIIIKDNGLYTEIFYKVKCTLENGDEEKIISISKYDLNDSNWITNKLGIKYYIAAKNNSYALFRIYLSKEFRNVIQEYEYDMVGWKLMGNKYLYLHGNGAIGSTDKLLKGSTNRRIEIDPSLSNHSALHGALTLLNLSDNPQKTIPLFLYSHLSVLMDLFNISGARPKFTLWIYGLTGSMKTSVSTIFFNLFNRVSKPEIPATFKDTSSAIEIKAFDTKDSTLLIDDYHPTTSSIEKRSMDALASHILRMYGDGITKSRATKTMGKQKEYPPRGLCVITGEDRLGGESTVARYIGIEVLAGDYKTNVLSYHQNNPLIFSTHMYYFIQWISYNYIETSKSIKNNFSKYRNDTNLFRHKRLNEAFSVFKIISEIFLHYCISVGYFDSNVANSTLNEWSNTMLQVIKTHEENNTNQDPAIMYIIAIDELISSNKCSLAKVGESYSQKQNIIGFTDGSYYYLIPETAYINVRNFWRYQGIEFPISQEQINKALDNLKLIETSIEAGKIRRTIKCNPDGKNRKRYLKINIELFKQILNN